MSPLPDLNPVVAIHQPHYLPWLRYIEKILRSDVFILLDDVQYQKNGFQNRNKIKTAQGWMYLTVPVHRPTQRPICEIRIDNRSAWQEKHRRALTMNYCKAPYFRRYWPELCPIYDRPWQNLADLCEAMLAILLRQLGVERRVVRSRDIPTTGQATDRLVELCRAVEGKTYLSGAYGFEQYVDQHALQAAGIRLAVQDWQAPAYAQLYPTAGFIPDLAIVDLLFNEGPNSGKILMAASGITYPSGTT